MTLSHISLDIEPLRVKICQARYHISEHVIRSLMSRDVTLAAIEQAVMNGFIIETHLHSVREMSCLILGYSKGIPVHVIFTNNKTDWPIILFAYSPSSPLWKDSQNRYKQEGNSMNETMQKCFFCAGELKDILIGNFDYRLEGRLYVIKQVPAILCLQCGEKYVSGETARKIDTQISAGIYSGTEAVQVLEYR